MSSEPTNNDLTIQDDIIALLRKEPFWGHVAISLRKVADPHMSTTVAVAPTRGAITLYYNPSLYFEMPLAERLADLIHEALHVVNRHFSRRQAIVEGNSIFSVIDADTAAMVRKMHPGCLARIANYAADMSINPLIKNISANSVFPGAYGFPDELSFEEYFTLLLKSLPKTPPKGGKGSDSGDGEGGDKGKGDGNGKQEGKGKGKGGGKGYGEQLTSPGGGGEGSRGNQPGDGHGAAEGHDCDCPACSGNGLRGNLVGDHSRWDGESEEDLRTADVIAASIIKDCHSRGLIPSTLLAQFDDILKPKFNLKAILNMFVASCKSETVTRTWMRVNRRCPYSLKGKRREDKLVLVIAIDSSGSITDAFLRLFAGFLMGFYREGVEIIVVECDAIVHRSYKFTGKIDRFKGRGGTAFQPVFDYLVENKIEADGIIYLTDGFGDNPPPYRKKKVLWLVTPKGQQPASWGKVVFLPPDVMVEAV